MKAKLFLGCAACVLLVACVTVSDIVGPLEARWYVEPLRPSEVDSDGKPIEQVESLRSERPQIEIVLLNRSPRRIEVLRVFLNAFEGDFESLTRTWVWQPKPGVPAPVLEPGEYKILRTNEFDGPGTIDNDPKTWFSNQCRIPVALSLDVPEETASWLLRAYSRFVGDDPRRVQVDMPDRLPNGIPYVRRLDSKHLGNGRCDQPFKTP